jgi:hypothetical protein
MTNYGAGLHARPRSNRSPMVAYSDAALEKDLQRVGEAWETLEATRRRTAIYPFLTAVFELVAWWAAEGMASGRAQRAIRKTMMASLPGIDPFAAIILVAAYPKRLDRRAVSRWSRVLRYALAYKPRSERLERFVRRKGGLNKCAALYARRLGRRAKTREEI